MCGYLSREITVFLVLAFKTDSVLSPDEKCCIPVQVTHTVVWALACYLDIESELWYTQRSVITARCRRVNADSVRKEGSVL